MQINSNAFHNFANIATAVLAAGTAALVSSGCVQNIDPQTQAMVFDCTKSWINPAYTTGAIAALQVAKLAVNAVRDGFGGMFKPQPPVQK